MKRLSSSDSLGALMTVCPASEEHMSPRNNSHVYGRDFRSMLDGLDEEGSVEESVQVSEKKRRLSVDQVKALEKNFEVENKLEPERKVKLAQELGLQPRQVAVWFQNRRARWKTKQLERDYGHLKANYDALRLNFDALQRDKQALLKEIKELKSKLQEENTESNLSVKEEVIIAAPEEPDQQLVLTCSDHRNNNDDDDDVNTKNMFEVTNIMFIDHFKDGSSDSDSSAVLNDDNITSNANTSTHNGNSNSSNPNNVVQPHQLSATTNDMSSSPSSYQPQQFVKIEEHNFFSGEETCNFFSDDQAPTLPWYCSGDDQWN